MSLLYLKLPFTGAASESELTAMFDSGASDSCIREDIFLRLGGTIVPSRYKFADGVSGSAVVRLKGQGLLHFVLDDVELSDAFYIVEDLTEEVIIGAATMQKYRMKLNFEEDKIELGPYLGKIKIINLNVKHS